MKKVNSYPIAVFALVTLMATAATAQAAYPKSVQLTVEFWNDTAQALHLNSASWFPAGTDLKPYGQGADETTNTFSLTLNNPRNDAVAFSVGAGGKVCEFRLGHEKKFSWISFNPVPQKFASAKSTGTVPAECTATVIKGSGSYMAYTTRVRME